MAITLYWNRNVLETLELCRQKLKTCTKKWKQKWKLAFFSINTSHQTEYLESISKGSKLHVQLHITDPDHHITNRLKSPQRVNTEVILPVLNFSGSVYQIKIGKLRGIQSPNSAFCVFYTSAWAPTAAGWDRVYSLSCVTSGSPPWVSSPP